MNLTTDNKLIADEVLRKIGRNVVTFQQIEFMLKSILESSEIDGFASQIEKNKQLRQEKFKCQTMGQLTTQLSDEVLIDTAPLTTNPNEITEPKEITEPWLSYRHQVKFTKEHCDVFKNDLLKITSARNELIHHFLPKWQPNSLDVLNQACVYLDEQHTKTLPVHEKLKSVLQSMMSARQVASDFMNGEGAEWFELQWLQTSKLVIYLRDLASTKSKFTDWIYLAGANSIAKQKFPQEFENLETQYGHSNLKKILVACELFEIEDEFMSNGNIRTRYRLKPVTKNDSV
jgi:hypothetical protein